MVRHTCHLVIGRLTCHPVIVQHTCHPVMIRHTCHPVMRRLTCHPERSEGSRCTQDDNQPQPAASPPSQRTPQWYRIPVTLLWYGIPVILSAAKDLPALRMIINLNRQHHPRHKRRANGIAYQSRCYGTAYLPSSAQRRFSLLHRLSYH